MISIDKAAKRYLQIKGLEDSIRLTEDGIAEVAKELDDCGTRLQELRKTKSDLLKQMRAAARDEGTLPLFDDLTHTLSVTPAGHEASI